MAELWNGSKRTKGTSMKNIEKVNWTCKTETFRKIKQSKKIPQGDLAASSLSVYVVCVVQQIKKKEKKQPTLWL
jgi:hypothetical protein